MGRVMVVVIVWLGTAALALAQGTVVAVGGGGTTEKIVARTLELAGGKDAVVAVLPQSSAVEGAGDSAVKMWLDAGARSAKTVDFADVAAARAALESATLIWIPGGDQTRFMKTIAGTGLEDVIRARLQAGAVVGGTSAGAAVLSKVMITGDEYDLQAITPKKTHVASGLGLWPEALVDQHFLKRQRHNRLLSAVLDQPSLIGVGIDEGTAVFVRGTRLEVLGRSAVIIIDARDAASGTNLRLHVLREGMTLDLSQR